MLLNPKKIMVVHNTQYANSKTVADYYAAARGLDTEHVKGYDFGTSDTITATAARDAFIAGALTSINSYIIANNIEGVAVSINCPRYYQPLVTTNHSFCRAISTYARIIDYANPSNLYPYEALSELAGYSATTYGPDGTAANKSWDYMRMRVTESGTGPYSYDTRTAAHLTLWGGPYQHVPCGRLGYHAGMGTDDATLAMRCIDDAVWFEQNGNSANEPMLFGFSTRGGASPVPFMEHGNIWDGWRYLHEKVGQVHTYDGNYVNANKYSLHNWSFSLPAITISNQASWLMGGGPAIDLWGWVGTGFENNGNAYLPSVSFKRGSWMFESTSSDASKHSLLNGSCCAIIPVTEPTNAGLPEIGGLIYFLMHGMSMEEARMASSSGGVGGSYTEVWGDPFYSPLIRSLYSGFRAISATNGTG